MPPMPPIAGDGAATYQALFSQIETSPPGPARTPQPKTLPPLRIALERSRLQLQRTTPTPAPVPIESKRHSSLERHYPQFSKMNLPPQHLPISVPYAGSPSAQACTSTPAQRTVSVKCKSRFCSDIARPNGYCQRHGKTPRCKVEGCEKTMQRKGLCRAHGGGKQCEVEGCSKAVQRFNRCHAHGGIRYCQFDGCRSKDRGGGFCVKHGGGVKCALFGCDRLARKKKRCTQHLRLLEQSEL